MKDRIIILKPKYKILIILSVFPFDVEYFQLVEKLNIEILASSIGSLTVRSPSDLMRRLRLCCRHAANLKIDV